MPEVIARACAGRGGSGRRTGPRHSARPSGGPHDATRHGLPVTVNHLVALTSDHE